MAMLPEEKARVKIDKQLRNAGWDIVSRNEYLPNSTTAVKEALMAGKMLLWKKEQQRQKEPVFILQQ